MRNVLIGLVLALSLPLTAMAEEAPKTPEQLLSEMGSEYPRFRFVTTQGNFVVELDGRRAPLTVANFYRHVTEGFYENTAFHRVINGFVAQGGGYDADYKDKDTAESIPNESGNGLKNKRGTIAMARTSKPHSATTQFFFNLVDNPDLDPLPTRWGYTVFGKVDEFAEDGMAVLDRIAHLPTGPSPDRSIESDVPQTPVIVKRIELLP